MGRWKLESLRVWMTAGCMTGILVLSGCGPVGSTSRIAEAEVAMERARVAEAHEKAPYEYYTARHYLHKSKEEWGYSDFQASKDYAAEAKRSAEAALLKAKEDPFTGSPVPQEKMRSNMSESERKERETEQTKEKVKKDIKEEVKSTP